MLLPQNEVMGHLLRLILLEVLSLQLVVLGISAYSGSLAAGVDSFIALLVFGKVDENLIFSREMKPLALVSQRKK